MDIWILLIIIAWTALLRTVLRMRSLEAFADSGPSSSSFAASAAASSAHVTDAEVLTLVRDHCRALRTDLLALTVEPLLAAFRTDPVLIASYFRYVCNVFAHLYHISLSCHFSQCSLYLKD